MINFAKVGITDSFQISMGNHSPLTPNVGTTYSVNQGFFDMVDTKASVSFDKPSYDFKTGLSTELNTALSGIIDYEKMANTMPPIEKNAFLCKL